MICSSGALGLICAVYVQYKHSQVAAIKHLNQLKSCRTCTCSCLGYHLNRTFMFSQGDKLSWFCYGIHVDGGINHSVKQMLLKQYKTVPANGTWLICSLTEETQREEKKGGLLLSLLAPFPHILQVPYSACGTASATLPCCSGQASSRKQGSPLQACAGLQGSIPRLAMPRDLGSCMEQLSSACALP